MSQDGKTVSYTVEADMNPDGTIVYDNVKRYYMDAQAKLYQAELKLQFPDMPVSYDELAKTNLSAMQENSMWLDLYPINANENTSVNELRTGDPTKKPIVDPNADKVTKKAQQLEVSRWQRLQDSLDFKLRTTLLPATGYASKTVIDPSREINRHIYVDDGAMQYYTANFYVTVYNPTPYTMTDIKVIEEGFDDRLFVKAVSTDTMRGTAVESITGYHDGMPTDIPIVREDMNAWHRMLSNKLIDTVTQDSVMGIATLVEDPADPMAPATAPKVDAHFDRVEVKFRSEASGNIPVTGGTVPTTTVELAPGQSIRVQFHMGFTDPYHLKDFITALGTNKITNAATVQGNVLVDGEKIPVTQDVTASYGIKQLDKHIYINKDTWQNDGVEIGSAVRYPITVYLDKAGKYQKFTNPVIVDFLPDGITLLNEAQPINSIAGTLRNSGLIKEVKLVPNYLDSGRRALIIYLKDFRMNELNGNLGFELQGTINENATTKYNAEAVENNTNRVYFYDDTFVNGADGTGEKPPYGDTLIEMRYNLPDIYDIDQDGNRSEKVIGSQSPLTVILPEAVRGVKYIRKYDPNLPEEEQDPWSRAPVYTNYEGEFQYKLSAINNAITSLTGLHINDRLPHLKDYEYIYRDGGYVARNSAFEPLMTGPIINPDPQKFTILYRADDWIPPNVVSALADTDLWRTEEQILDWTKVNAFYIKMNEGYTIEGYKSADFIVPMKAPMYVYGQHLNAEMANNNFAISYDGKNWGQSNIVSDGLVVNIPVRKKWDGGRPEDHVAVEVELLSRIKDSGQEFVPAKDKDGNPVTKILNANDDPELNWQDIFRDLPVVTRTGSPIEYMVREKETPENYVSSMTGNVDDGFAITNTYVSPQFLIRGTKKWIGGPDPLDEFDANGLIPKEAVGTVHYVNSIPKEGEVDPWTSSKMNDRYRQSDGAPYNYIIREVRSPYTVWPNSENYTQIVDSEEIVVDGELTEWHFTVQNEYHPPRTDVIASKVWEGGDYQYPRILIDLFRYRLGEDPATAVLVNSQLEPEAEGVDAVASATTNISPYHIYKNLPETDKTDGTAYVYRIEERDLTKMSQAELDAYGITQEDLDAFENYRTQRNTAADPFGVHDPNLSLINIYTSPKITVEGIKLWKGGENEGLDRSASIELRQNGKKYLPTEEETAAGMVNPILLEEGQTTATWTVDRTDFFEQPYNYSIVEVDVLENYTAIYDAPVETTDEKGNLIKLSQNITNEFTPNTIEVTAHKVWNGGPAEKPGYELQLVRQLGWDETTREVVGAPVALLIQTSHTWLVPEKDSSGQTYDYYVEESTPPENYTPSYQVIEGIEDRLTIVNAFTPQPLTVPIAKSWIGGSIEDRPESVEVGLYVGEDLAVDIYGQPLSLELSADEGWKGAFLDVPAIDENLENIVYNVREVAVPRFETAYDGDQTRGFQVINTFVPDVHDVVATKEWSGGVDRPAVELQLYRNGVALGDPAGLNGVVDTQYELSAWKATWKDMPVQDMTGTDYVYTVQEVVVPEHYISDYKIVDGKEDRLTIVNTYQPSEISFTVDKEWVNGPAEHPAAVFQLIRQIGNGTEENVGGPVYVTEEMGNTYTWIELPETDINGAPYTYQAKELLQDNRYGSVSEVPVKTGSEYTQKVTNTYLVPVTTIAANKIWAGGPDAKPTITLILEQRDSLGNTVDFAEQDLIAGDPDGLWENVPLTDEKGLPYTYSVREKEVPDNYISTVDGLSITNTYAIPKDGEVTAKKIWEGGPDHKPEVYFELYRHIGTQTATRVPNTDNQKVVTAPGEKEAEVTWTGLEMRDEKGNDYVFTVREVGTPPGYDKEEMGLTVTNRYQIPKTSFTATKTWQGGPTEKPGIALELYRHTEDQQPAEAQKVDTQVLASGQSSYTWNDLDKTDSMGNPYLYFVDEPIVPAGYQKELGEVTYTLFGNGRQSITNTFVSPIEAIHVQKQWVGGDDIRPDQIQVQLFRQTVGGNKEFVGDPITLTQGDDWKGQWTDLMSADPKANPYTYFVQEVGSIENFRPTASTGSGTAADPFVITNSYDLKSTDFTVFKNWVGGPVDKPDVEMTLYRQVEGGELEVVPSGLPLVGLKNPATIQNGDVFYTWKNLPVTDNQGKTYSYTVMETSVDGIAVENERAGDYTVSQEGNVITNRYNSPNLNLFAKKIWVGGNAADHRAPEMVLYQNGRILDVAPAVDPAQETASAFTYTWNVPLTDSSGEKYNYAVDEKEVPVNYGKSIETQVGGDTLITNTYLAQTTDISVHKDWVGGQAPYPAITFALQRRVEAEDFETVATEVLEPGDHIHIWKGQPLTDDGDRVYEYRVIETKISTADVVDSRALFYEVSYAGDVAGGFTVTNTAENSMDWWTCSKTGCRDDPVSPDRRRRIRSRSQGLATDRTLQPDRHPER
ncbi:MAG: Cna B-type domain-containing protein [Tissierellia bacterium]|nr:Cna B-type domain-containing protein [Tissierellia bacterium]